MKRRRFLTFSAAYLASSWTAAAAESVSLTLDGDINNKQPILLQDADLTTLPQIEIKTETPWTKGEKTFSGPALSSVLDRWTAGPGKLRLKAINNYSINMAQTLISDNAPIIATHINGAPLNRRDNGPHWIVFPYSESGEFRNERIYAVSVWQLIKITVLQA
jgi:hypothetical protein